jgi:hypothetical protein
VYVPVTVSKTKGKQAHVEIRNAKYENFMPLGAGTSKEADVCGAREAVKLVGE